MNPGRTDPLTVVLSLPEVNSLVMRAARGAGFTWGMAEECGQAAVWLAGHGLDWSAVILARLLGAKGAQVVPNCLRWANNGAVCGLHAGVTLVDFATLPEGPGREGVAIGVVYDPICLLPFVARAAKATQSPLDILLDGRLWASVDKTGRLQKVDKLEHSATGAIEVRPTTKTVSGALVPVLKSAAITASAYASLETLALNMTVPATALSQARAGASESDND